MKKRKLLSQLILMLIMTLCSYKSYSVDIIKFQRQQMSAKKAAHNIDVIRSALEITEAEYGPFELEIVNMNMSVGRMLKATFEGKIINTVIVPASQLWDSYNIPIKVPVRLGLLNYRVLLVNKADLPAFEKIKNLEQLNHFTAGLIKDWVTTEIFRLNDLQLMETGHFEGIFLMLNKHRFDYIPRGVYEVYDELNARKSMLTDIVVEPTIALYIPTSTYVYVSPKQPRIAKRIDVGLHKLLANGQLKDILYKHYASDINRAKLSTRKIFEIDNPYYKKDQAYDKFLFLVH